MLCYLQLTKFWPFRAPGKGVCGGAKIFGCALLEPERSVCVSVSALLCLCTAESHQSYNSSDTYSRFTQLTSLSVDSDSTTLSKSQAEVSLTHRHLHWFLLVVYFACFYTSLLSRVSMQCARYCFTNYVCLSVCQSINQSINQFNSNLAARQPDSK